MMPADYVLTFECVSGDYPARVIQWYGGAIVQMVETDTHRHGTAVILRNIMREHALRPQRWVTS